MEELPIKIPSKDSKPIRKEGKFTIYLSPDGTQFKAFTVDENSFRNRALNVEERTDAIQKPKEELKLVEKKEPEPIPHWTALGYGDPKMSVITADNRSKWQRAQDDKKTKAWLAAEHKKDIDLKVTNYMLLPAGILLALATPAAPYVNATLFAHSTNNLHDLYQNGTLGFNLETGINTLGLIPGLSSVKAATTPIWAPVAAKTFNGIRNYRMAKAFDNIVRSEIKKKDWFNKNFPLYTYKPQPYNNRLGLPESDPNTFYHYMYYPSPININGEGVVRFSNFTIKPKYNGLNERIWWDKGGVPTGDVVLSSKSKYIDEHVLSHPEKYSPYRGYYENSYYTSGNVPINEVNIYTKNPFTGYYDGPHNTITYNPIKLNEGKTSLKFFEKPSKLTEAERLGIPKGDRGNLTQALQQAIEDFALYRTSGQYRQTLKFTPDGTDYRWTYANAEGPTFLKYFTDRGKALRGTWGRIVTPDLTGVLSYHINRNAAGYSANFPKPEGLNYPVGEANMFLDGNNQKLILTAPRTDFFAGSIEEGEALQAIGNSLPNTIDKGVMRNFWINARKALRPGTYLSGDNGAPPLGSLLIQAYNSKKLHTHPYYERPIKEQLVIRDGLSPDSYSSIIRLGTRDGSLRWGEGFSRWNNSAVLNKYIYQAYKDLLSGKITPELYELIFNKWSFSLGGKPLQWVTRGGIKRPVHPHPYIYAKKLGGRLVAKLKINKLNF